MTTVATVLTPLHHTSFDAALLRLGLRIQFLEFSRDLLLNSPISISTRGKEVETRRDNILNEIIARDLCRPEHNVLRNENEPMESDDKTVYEEDVRE